MSFSLFQLVPAVYRLRDARIAQSMQLLTLLEQTTLNSLQAIAPPLTIDQQTELNALTAKAARGPLESLLMVVEEQLAAFAEDLDQLYDDQFIETCAPWVIPYIGDLIGYQSIQGIAPAVDNSRAEVAQTISLRRRKGTVLVLEQLARDVTGWGAHAVEFFRVLADTQYMKHIRRENLRSPDVRDWRPRFYRNSGFSRMTRTVDVHNPASPGLPRYNIQNLGIFLWSLGAYGITRALLTPASKNTADALCYRFNSLGMDMPLFHRAISQGEQIAAAARQVNVPDRLHRLDLCADMQNGAGSSYYGAGSSLALYSGGQLLNPYQLQVANLSGPDGSWHNAPATGKYAALVDPELGRLAIPPPAAGADAPVLTASWFYGFNAKMGGGEYEREATFTVTNQASIFPFPDTAAIPRYHDLQSALTFVVSHISLEGRIALEMTNSDALTLTSGGVSVDLPAGATIEFRAADGTRPTLRLDGEFVVTGDASSTFIINGLLIGAVPALTPKIPSPAALVRVPATRPSGSANLLGVLNLTHCTLVPGWSVDTSGEPLPGAAPSLRAEAPGVQISATRSIVGPILAVELASVSLTDSIIDATDHTQVAYAAPAGPGGGGALTLQGCTVIGKVHASVLSLVSNSIIWAALSPVETVRSALIADRKQEGCVRFSFLPLHAVTPRRFECVEQALASAQPNFFTFRYGRPSYLKMLACTDDAIRRGADDGGEMGAFHFVLAPQRETDLSVRLQEYLPVGLDVELIYQS